jgi:tetratricopeptide (TPR) repeat protein
MSDDKEEKVLSFDRSKRTPDPARLAEFTSTARKLLRERKAGDVITKLLHDTPREEWPRIAENAEARNSGTLDRLSREVAASLEKDPASALAMSNLATTIAETLPADNYPPIVTAQIRAHAWKDRAQALSYVGRDAEALEAIERAESLLAPFSAVAHDRAVVRLVKAIVLQHLKQWDESLALLKECLKVFSDHRDSKRVLHCGMTEAMLLHRRGEYQRSHDVLEQLLPVARTAGDIDSIAAIHQNIGTDLLNLDEFTAANIHFSEAVRHFNDSGRKIEAARAEMNIGKLFVRKWQAEPAMSHLAAAREVFERSEMPEETGMCGALMMEAMLLRGNDAQARSIAGELASQLRGTRVSRQALEAINYVDHAIEAHDDALAAVRHVHEYFETLLTDPDRQFAAPS